MNLNAEAGDNETFDSLFTTDTDPANVDTDTVDQVNPLQPVTEQKLIVTNSDRAQQPYHPTPEELFGSPLVKNELPNLNAVFIETTTDKINSARDLVEIQEQIKSANGIGREDAELIASLVPDFTENKPLGFFTEERSMTQLKETVQTLGNEIDIRISTISQAIADYLDTAHQKYLPIIQTIEKNALDKIVSLQLEVQKLSLAFADSSIPLKCEVSLNDLLEIEIGNDYDSETTCPEYLKLPESVKKAILESNALFQNGSSFRNKLAGIYYTQLHSLSGLYFPVGNNGYKNGNNGYVELKDSAPSVTDVDPAIKYDPSPSYAKNTLYYHTTLSTGEHMVSQIKAMIGFLSFTVSAFPQYKATMKELLADETISKDKVLETLQNGCGDNVRDALIVLNIIAFLESFTDHVNALKNIYIAIGEQVINNKSVSTEGIVENLKNFFSRLTTSQNKISDYISKLKDFEVVDTKVIKNAPYGKIFFHDKKDITVKEINARLESINVLRKNSIVSSNSITREIKEILKITNNSKLSNKQKLIELASKEEKLISILKDSEVKYSIREKQQQPVNITTCNKKEIEKTIALLKTIIDNGDKHWLEIDKAIQEQAKLIYLILDDNYADDKNPNNLDPDIQERLNEVEKYTDDIVQLIFDSYLDDSKFHDKIIHGTYMFIKDTVK